MVATARALNPWVVVVRSHHDEEAKLLRQDRIGEVFMGEQQLALAMARHVRERAAGGTVP